MPVKKGDVVKLEYEGTLNDGTVFDSSKNHGAPLEFEVGSGLLMEAFETAIVGMEPGEEKEFKLKAEEAYGEHKEQLVRDVPRDKIPQSDELKEGIMLVLGLPEGLELQAVVVNLTDDTVTLDLNHPLAGKDLKFKVKLIEINT